MQLPHSLARLAGCCWLPRHVAKSRIFLRSEMPLSYRIAFGSRVGVDGYFFRHFGLRRAQMLAAIRARSDDAAVGDWFLQRPGVNPGRIAEWNRLAPLLGAEGHPGFRTRQIVKWLLYPKSITRPVGSIFSAIVQDEGLPADPPAD